MSCYTRFKLYILKGEVGNICSTNITECNHKNNDFHFPNNPTYKSAYEQITYSWRYTLNYDKKIPTSPLIMFLWLNF